MWPAANISTFLVIIICPSERVARAKVRAKDDTLQLDSPFLQTWTGCWLAQLSRGEPSQPVFDFNCPNLLCEIKDVGRLVGITEEVLGQSQRGGLQPYQLRHSGASINMNIGFQTATQIQKKDDGHLREVSQDTNAGIAWRRVAIIHGTDGGLHRIGRISSR